MTQESLVKKSVLADHHLYKQKPEDNSEPNETKRPQPSYNSLKHNKKIYRETTEHSPTTDKCIIILTLFFTDY